MSDLSPSKLILLALVALLLFGAKRLPEIGRSLGTGMREFKSSVSGETPPSGHLAEPDKMTELGHSIGSELRELKHSISGEAEPVKSSAAE
jgi:sec-independent protein translocase protein TatA